jgi:MFS-type transporter involved in bile tolerance (Atg22 family)
VLYGTIGDYVEKDRLARAFGFFYTLGSICGIAAPLGYGLIGDLQGVETSMGIIGIAIFLTVPLAALLKPGTEARLKSA